MPLDQTSPQFLGQLRDLAKGFLAWAGEEGAEGHHPPNMPQHQQALQQQSPQQPPAGSLTAPQPDADVNEPPPYPQKAAGMLLMAPDGRALFVRRTGDDHPGEWSLPGGMTKGDEQPWQTAHREANEELGPFDCDTNAMQLIDHNYDGKLGFTTYGGKVNDAFTPVLNHEHDAYQWATPDQAPQPLHPGLKATLDFALDPLTEKGSKIMSSMKSQYGPEKGEQVFYASRNAGKISGVDNPMDAIPTSGRRDTQIHTIHPSGHMSSAPAANPFNANLDTWASPSWDVGTAEGARKAAQTRAGGAGAPAAKPDPMGEYRHALRAQQREPGIRNFMRMVGKSMAVNPTQHPTMESADWASPRWDQASTGKTQEIASAVQGKVRDPQAVAATTRAKMIGRPALQQKAAAARSGDAGSLASRFKLYDSAGGVLYDIDKPLPFARSPQPQDSKPVQDDWGQPQASDPMTKPAMSAPHQMSTAPVPGMAGGMRSAPQPGGNMHGNPMMAGAGKMNAGPKYTQSVKMDYGDGTVDERKLTRPGGPPPQAQQWLSPKWQSPQQGQQQQPQDAWPTAAQPQQQRPRQQPIRPPPQDAGWPTATNIGPSAKTGGPVGSAP